MCVVEVRSAEADARECTSTREKEECVCWGTGRVCIALAVFAHVCVFLCPVPGPVGEKGELPSTQLGSSSTDMTPSSQVHTLNINSPPPSRSQTRIWHSPLPHPIV